MNATPPPLTPLRWIFAVIGALVMVFCGGCAVLGLAAGLSSTDSLEQSLAPVFAVIGGAGFLFGLLIWWLAVKANRRSEAQ